MEPPAVWETFRVHHTRRLIKKIITEPSKIERKPSWNQSTHHRRGDTQRNISTLTKKNILQSENKKLQFNSFTGMNLNNIKLSGGKHVPKDFIQHVAFFIKFESDAKLKFK